MKETIELESALSSYREQLESAESLSERLNLLVKVVGNVSAFARLTGLSVSGLKRYLSGGEPTASKLLQISDSIGLNVQWLLTGKGPMRLDEQASGGQAAPRSAFEEEFALVSRKDIEVSAGHGAWTEDENHRDFLAFRKTWLNQQGFKVEDLVAVVVRGDSMEPTLSEGDTVLVHTTETRVTDGIYVIRIDDDIFVKRLQHRFGGEVEVISDNKEYRSQVLSGQQLQKMCIIGRVVWMGGMI